MCFSFLVILQKAFVSMFIMLAAYLQWILSKSLVICSARKAVSVYGGNSDLNKLIPVSKVLAVLYTGFSPSFHKPQNCSHLSKHFNTFYFFCLSWFVMCDQRFNVTLIFMIRSMKWNFSIVLSLKFCECKLNTYMHYV